MKQERCPMETLKIIRKIDSISLQIDELRFWMGKEVDIIIREKTSTLISSEEQHVYGWINRHMMFACRA
ncbi:MAG: hypothetical protein WDZ80_03400, partial [Candidatus Paceibacterota bacterium]